MFKLYITNERLPTDVHWSCVSLIVDPCDISSRAESTVVERYWRGSFRWEGAQLDGEMAPDPTIPHDKGKAASRRGCSYLTLGIFRTRDFQALSLSVCLSQGFLFRFHAYFIASLSTFLSSSSLLTGVAFQWMTKSYGEQKKIWKLLEYLEFTWNDSDDFNVKIFHIKIIL